jgi:7-cyano-7-deazaguanine synthase
MSSIYDKLIEETPNMKETKKVVVSLSGGLDSTILLYLMVERYGKDNVYALSYNYNQRHDIELIQAKKTTKRLGVIHKVLDISFMGDVAAGVSAMVKGSVATPTMEDVLGEPQPVTYMPNRNMMLASITAAFAESVGADSVALGIQKIDSYAYWDTTPEFYEAIGSVFKLNRKFPIKFVAPFITLSKVEEIHLAAELGVELGETWTCYNPTITEKYPTIGQAYPDKVMYHHQPCGTCPSCFERAEAFKKVGIADPVVQNGVIA